MIDDTKISEILNLIGYGMAKFDRELIKEFGCSTKTAFAQLIVDLGLAKTIKAVTNRQDSFDPYFDNGRRGWFQRNQREHIKLFIDSLFGNEDAKGFANIIKMYIHDLDSNIQLTNENASPSTQSKFKQLQETGKEAEFYFMNNFQTILPFQNATLEDARLWGDGYDFQLQIDSRYILTEVKGVREKSGAIRMTQNEFLKAQEYRNDYYLVIVSNLQNTPKLSYFENPIEKISLEKRTLQSVQYIYQSESLIW